MRVAAMVAGVADNCAMALITLSNAHLAFGHVALLDGTSFSLEAGERVALIGRNGTGKSSLLKILAGLERADDGVLQVQQGLRRTYVPQEPLFEADATVFEAASEGAAEARELRQRYEQHREGDDLDALQTRIEALDGWMWEQRVEQTLQRLHLDGQAHVHTLSGRDQEARRAGAGAGGAPGHAVARRADQSPGHRLPSSGWRDLLVIVAARSPVVSPTAVLHRTACASDHRAGPRAVCASTPCNHATDEGRRRRSELAAEEQGRRAPERNSSGRARAIRKVVEATPEAHVGRAVRAPTRLPRRAPAAASAWKGASKPTARRRRSSRLVLGGRACECGRWQGR